jgi:enamine deaminase RidA (YjgF/YER057c/UK114 family)
MWAAGSLRWPYTMAPFIWQARYAFSCCAVLVHAALSRLKVVAVIARTAECNQLARLHAQVPEDTSQDIVGQTKQVLQYIDDLLARAGSDKTKILIAQIHLADLSDFDGMNTAWDAWVPEGHAPPRATVQSKLAKPDWRVEIVVTAAV